MSIDDFLKNLDAKKKAQEEQSQSEKKLKELKAEKAKNYVAEFDQLYIDRIYPELQTIGKKLSHRFEVEIDGTAKEQQHLINDAKMTLKPRFHSGIKKVKIIVIGEGHRELITLVADAYSAGDIKINDKTVLTFQDTVTKFNKLNLEKEIGEMLNQIYI